MAKPVAHECFTRRQETESGWAMQFQEFQEHQQALLDEFRSVRGVIEFDLFDSGDEEIKPSAHRQAVIMAISKHCREINEWQDKVPIDPKSGSKREDLWRCTIDEAAASVIEPKQISWDEFLGPMFDSTRQELIFPNVGGYYYASDEPDSEANRFTLTQDVGRASPTPSLTLRTNWGVPERTRIPCSGVS